MAGFVRIRQIESRACFSFGRTLRLSSDCHMISCVICFSAMTIALLLILHVKSLKQLTSWKRKAADGCRQQNVSGILLADGHRQQNVLSFLPADGLRLQIVFSFLCADDHPRQILQRFLFADSRRQQVVLDFSLKWEEEISPPASSKWHKQQACSLAVFSGYWQTGSMRRMTIKSAVQNRATITPSVYLQTN